MNACKPLFITMFFWSILYNPLILSFTEQGTSRTMIYISHSIQLYFRPSYGYHYVPRRIRIQERERISNIEDKKHKIDSSYCLIAYAWIVNLRVS